MNVKVIFPVLTLKSTSKRLSISLKRSQREGCFGPRIQESGGVRGLMIFDSRRFSASRELVNPYDCNIASSSCGSWYVELTPIDPPKRELRAPPEEPPPRTAPARPAIPEESCATGLIIAWA